MSSEPKPIIAALDTNILVSALISGGPPREIVGLSFRGIFRACVSPFILQETRSVLERKLGWPSKDASGVVRWLEDKLTVVPPSDPVHLIERKKSDNRILECAVAAHAEYLVTGDKKDLLPLHTFRGIRIVRPIDFLGVLAKSPPAR